jgi:predicted ABC-type ATPase
MKSLLDIHILKSRTRQGVYADNAENRRLHRVGQPYKTRAQAEREEWMLQENRKRAELTRIKDSSKKFLNNLRGVSIRPSGESTANGASVYYTVSANGREAKVRFSDHSVTSAHRVMDEIHFNRHNPLQTINEIYYTLGFKGVFYGYRKVTEHGQTFKRWGFYRGEKPDEYLKEKNAKYKEKGLDYDTFSLDEYANDENRQQFNSEIVASYVAKSSRYNPEKPIAVFTGGGSGSGKSTVLDGLKQKDRFYNKVVVVDSDDIKTEAYYSDFLAYNAQNKDSAASRLHDESSKVATKAVEAIQAAENDYVKDGTLANYDKVKKQILAAKNKGYETRIVHVTIPVEEAIKRAQERAQKTNRKVPLDKIIKTHKGSTETFIRLLNDGIVDDVKLYDNTGKNPELIFDSTKKPAILDKEKFKQFLNKKDFVMTEKIEKSFRNFVPDESDKEFKRRFQAASPEEREGWGYDLVDTDDPHEDAMYCMQANKWLRDGQPVD